jgi:hypothetical protein
MEFVKLTDIFPVYGAGINLRGQGATGSRGSIINPLRVRVVYTSMRRSIFPRCPLLYGIAGWVVTWC